MKLILLASTLIALQANATTACYIYLTKPCLAAIKANKNTNLKPNQWVQDSHMPANLDAGRCIERAQEYKNWCGTSGIEATAGFFVGSRLVIQSYTYEDGRSYIATGKSRFTGFTK